MYSVPNNCIIVEYDMYIYCAYLHKTSEDSGASKEQTQGDDDVGEESKNQDDDVGLTPISGLDHLSGDLKTFPFIYSS